MAASNRCFWVFSVVFGEFCHNGLPLHFLIQPYQLLFVMIFHRFLNRSDGVEQIAVALLTILGSDGGRLGCNQPFLDQTIHVLFDGIVTHTNRFANGFVTWVTLKGVPIFTIHKIGVDQDFTAA